MLGMLLDNGLKDKSLISMVNTSESILMDGTADGTSGYQLVHRESCQLGPIPSRPKNVNI